MQERFADAQIFEKYSNKINISPAGLSLQRGGGESWAWRQELMEKGHLGMLLVWEESNHSPSLEMFKVKGMRLGATWDSEMSLPVAGGWKEMMFKVLAWDFLAQTDPRALQKELGCSLHSGPRMAAPGAFLWWAGVDKSSLN